MNYFFSKKPVICGALMMAFLSPQFAKAIGFCEGGLENLGRCIMIASTGGASSTGLIVAALAGGGVGPAVAGTTGGSVLLFVTTKISQSNDGSEKAQLQLIREDAREYLLTGEKTAILGEIFDDVRTESERVLGNGSFSDLDIAQVILVLSTN